LRAVVRKSNRGWSYCKAIADIIDRHKAARLKTKVREDLDRVCALCHEWIRDRHGQRDGRACSPVEENIVGKLAWITRRQRKPGSQLALGVALHENQVELVAEAAQATISHYATQLPDTYDSECERGRGRLGRGARRTSTGNGYSESVRSTRSARQRGRTSTVRG